MSRTASRFKREALHARLRWHAPYRGARNSPHGAPLKNWPVLTKTVVASNEEAFCRESIVPSIPASTGGTTGQPMKLWRTWWSTAFEQAVIDHICLTCQVDAAEARVAVLRGDSIKRPDDMSPPFWIDEGPLRRIFSAPISARERQRPTTLLFAILGRTSCSANHRPCHCC
jgi:phenylacetate-CoA ligase